jgi:hypothetical protein
MIPATHKLKGDIKARARVQRLRERRKQADWQAYELWLPPETAAVLAALKAPREALHETIGRALAALQAQGTMPAPTPMSGEVLTPAQRKAALVARLHELKAQGLSLQAIANQLNAAGVPTISGRGGWQPGTVGNLLAQRGTPAGPK